MFDKKSKFLFTAETTPNISTDLAASAGRIDELVNLADAVNVTDSPNCKVRLSSLLVASAIKAKGLDVVLQVTGRDRNRVALESEILGALSVGINKILCLSGDQPGTGGPVVVNELNSLGLTQLCQQISGGALTDGTKIDGPAKIYAGSADDIYSHLADPSARNRLLAKVENGSTFIQTQYCFDLATIEEYAKQLTEHTQFQDCAFLVGMGPLASAKQADWMRKNLWGVHIPDPILQRLEESKDASKEGETICEELIEKMMDIAGISGVHLMGPNCEKRSARIISRFVRGQDLNAQS